MNVMRKVKQIGSAMAGASLVGATLMGAAADLSMYPAPFVQNGILNALIVVGEDAKTSDTLGAIDIAASLQASATTPVSMSGGAGRTILSGDVVEIGEPSDMLEMEEVIGSVKEVITDNHLSALTGGTITTDQGSTEYNQYLRLQETDGSIESCLVRFGEDEYDEVGDFLYCKDGWTVFEYELEFEEGLESDVKTVSSELHLDDLEDENINIFGTDFTIVSAIIKNDSSIAGAALWGDNLTITLQMLGGDVVDTLGEGETRTYTIDGVDYEVTSVFISDGGSSGSETAKFSVNGEITDELEDGETDILSNGLEIGVREVLTNQREGIVEFFLGANKIQLQDTDCGDQEFYTSGVEITEENIEDASVRIKCAKLSGSGTLAAGDEYEVISIKYRLDADSPRGDVWIPAGHGLREFLDEPQGMLNPTWDLRYEGLLDTGTSEIIFDPNGDDSYNLVFTTREGLEYSVPLLTNEDAKFKFGDDDNELIFEEHCGFLGSIGLTTASNHLTNTTYGAQCYNIHEDDYFVVTDDNDETGFTHVLRFESIDDSNNVVTFNDLATGNREVTYSGTETTLGSASGTLTVGGKSYTVYVYSDGTNFKLAIDLDNSGAFTIGNEANIVVQGGGVLDLGTLLNATSTAQASAANYSVGNVSGSDVNMTLTTLASEFDESGINNSGNDEAVPINIVSRTGNEVGLSINSSGVDGGHTFYQLQSLQSNNDVDQALTMYGVFMEIFDESGSDEAEQLTIQYPGSQRGVEVFITAGAYSSTQTGSGAGGAVAVNPAAVGIGVLDSEVSLGRGNLIVVGGSCVNSIAAELMGNPTDCTQGFTPGKAVIKMFDTQNAVLVAGYSAQDTLGAAYVLADYEDYELVGNEVEVVVADLDSISVNPVA